MGTQTDDFTFQALSRSALTKALEKADWTLREASAYALNRICTPTGGPCEDIECREIGNYLLQQLRDIQALLLEQKGIKLPKATSALWDFPISTDVWLWLLRNKYEDCPYVKDRFPQVLELQLRKECHKHLDYLLDHKINIFPFLKHAAKAHQHFWASKDSKCHDRNDIRKWLSDHGLTASASRYAQELIRPDNKRHPGRQYPAKSENK